MNTIARDGGIGPSVNRTVTANTKDMLGYAHIWDPYNPLYNDPHYGKKTGWGAMPALPCYIFMENISGFPMMDEAGDALGNIFYYANDGGDIELFKHVYDGDTIAFRSGMQTITDTTDPNGSRLRQFSLYGEAEMRNQRGELIGTGKGYGRNAMMRITQGAVPSEYEQTYEWIDYMPPVHVTTAGEWELIEGMWRSEGIRGAQTLWWDDVEVGDQVAPLCSGPISDLEMMRLHGDMLVSFPSARDQILAGETLMVDAYGQKLPFLGRHYSYCRNPKARAVFYNFTARNFILRMITNWMGDDGFITAFKWRFQNLFKCMSGNEPGKEFLEKVPAMKGRFVNRHGMEGDTAICKGAVTGKYIQDGRRLVQLTCWAETFDGDVIQVVEAAVELPARH